MIFLLQLANYHNEVNTNNRKEQNKQTAKRNMTSKKLSNEELDYY
jgi:hypothetical protein